MRSKSVIRQFFDASTKGKTSKVVKFIAAGVNVNHVAKYGNTALNLAITHGHTAIVNVLIAAGANVNYVDNHNTSLLCNAIFSGSDPIVDALIAAGANISLTNESGTKAIHYATQSVFMMKMLIREGADWEAMTLNGQRPLHFACKYGHDDCAVFLINECGVDHRAIDNDGHDARWYINTGNACAETKVRMIAILDSAVARESMYM